MKMSITFFYHMPHKNSELLKFLGFCSSFLSFLVWPFLSLIYIFAFYSFYFPFNNSHFVYHSLNLVFIISQLLFPNWHFAFNIYISPFAFPSLHFPVCISHVANRVPLFIWEIQKPCWRKIELRTLQIHVGGENYTRRSENSTDPLDAFWDSYKIVM